MRGRRERLGRQAQLGDRAAKAEGELLERLAAVLDAGKPLRTESFWREDEAGSRLVLSELSLLTAKPVLFVANVGEKDLPAGEARLVDPLRAVAAREGAEVVVICGKLESEVAQLPEAERAEFLSHAGLAECGLDALIRAGYRILHLETFFTAGPKEVRAWTVPSGRRPRRRRASSTRTSSAGSSARRRSGSRTTSPRRRGRREGAREDADRGQGLRRAGRRRDLLPVQRVSHRAVSLAKKAFSLLEPAMSVQADEPALQRAHHHLDRSARSSRSLTSPALWLRQNRAGPPLGGPASGRPVSRVLSPEGSGGHSSRAAVAGRLERPTRQSKGTGRALPSAELRRRLLPYLVFLRMGFAVPAASPSRRWALTPPFHPCLIRAARPSAVCSLWHFPGPCDRWPLATILPCEARTFLGRREA